MMILLLLLLLLLRLYLTEHFNCYNYTAIINDTISSLYCSNMSTIRQK